MLYALLEEHDPAIEAALGSGASEVHAELKRSLGTGEDRMWEGILVTPRVRSVIRMAEEWARDRDVEPIDLFEAIARSGGGLAADILARAKRNPDAPSQ